MIPASCSRRPAMFMLSFASLILILALSPSHAAAQASSSANPAFTPLFTAGEGGYTMYRIPGIVVTAKGTILAYCEGRMGGGDWGEQEVLLRRSIDGGRTWSAPVPMAVGPSDLQPNPVAAKQKRNLPPGKFTAHNSIAIPDLQPGVVHFIYHLEYARVFYRRSEDDGATWSAPREITPAIAGFRERYDWKVVGNGCGHGLQLSAGPHRGRLVVPVWLSLGTGGGAHRPSDLAVIYSDDCGATWQRGDFIIHNGDPAASGEPMVNPSETALVELSGGRVLANIRNESTPNRRLLSVSADGATGWSKPEFCEALKEPVCMAGMTRLKDGALLFSNPDNLLVKGKEGKPGKNRDRRNLRVKLSRDGGKTWPVAKVIEPGFSGYSDLATAPDGTIFCFFERGATGANHFYPATLTLARFSREWLEK